MKFALRSASSAAILVGIAGAIPAWAQVDQVPAAAPAVQEDDTARVVVTGSFIRGTPEDAALPVEVFSQEELQDRGSPSALEFAKSLTIAGPTSGEAYYFGGPALIGSVNYNLRGIGADKTLTLLNGRRMNSNTSNIPFAISSTATSPSAACRLTPAGPRSRPCSTSAITPCSSPPARLPAV